MSQKQIMVDIETLGTKPGSVIISIGAVEVTPDGWRNPFEVNIKPESCSDYGMSVDCETVVWWMQQGADAQKVFSEQAISIAAALEMFSGWLGSGVCVWGNGSDFDNVLLLDAFDRCGFVAPWRYSKSRCYRTIAAMCPGVLIERNGTHHRAIDDAKTQATHLVKCLKALGIDEQVLAN